MEISPSRKRPRPVVSCLRCREKKLKCDRATPCQNCSKAGCRAECSYNQHPHLQSSGSLPKAKRVRISPERDGTDQRSQSQSRSGTGIIEDLQQRVVKLEELLAVRPHAGNFGLMRDAPVQSSWYVFLSSSYELFLSRTSSFQPSSSTSLSSLISFSYFLSSKQAPVSIYNFHLALSRNVGGQRDADSLSRTEQSHHTSQSGWFSWSIHSVNLPLY